MEERERLDCSGICTNKAEQPQQLWCQAMTPNVPLPRSQQTNTGRLGGRRESSIQNGYSEESLMTKLQECQGNGSIILMDKRQGGSRGTTDNKWIVGQMDLC